MEKLRNGFIYIWYDRKRKMFYIGSHLGTETDGYICSSNRMRDAYRRRPHDFKRRIIETHTEITYKQLLEREELWLNLIDDENLGKRYYNLRKHAAHWASSPNDKLTIGEKISKAHKSNPNWGKWAKGKIVSQETKEKIRKTSLKQFSNPEMIEKFRQDTSKRWEDPEYRRINTEKKKGRIWITDGTTDKQIYPGLIPEGFVRGRIKNRKNYYG